MKTMVVLGSTGSIGRQTLEVAEHLGWSVAALTGYSNEKLISEQYRRFHPHKVWISEEKYKSLKSLLADTAAEVVTGREELLCIASETECDALVNALVGISGLKPTLAALNGKKRVALANKETLVAFGGEVMRRAAESGTRIIPVDSEHSAIFQCLGGKKPQKLLLTCSGGPFFGKTSAELVGVTAEMALSHPNWKMGAKITVDCATLMNKGLELIEAVRLFGVAPDQVEILIHRESIMHSAVEFPDNAVLAQLALPDMRECIQYALTYPERLPSLTGRLDLTQVGKLTFAKPDTAVFPLPEFARECIKKDGTSPAAMSGANEEAVRAFLSGRIAFSDIPTLVTEASEETYFIPSPSPDEVLAADAQARENVLRRIK